MNILSIGGATNIYLNGPHISLRILIVKYRSFTELSRITRGAKARSCQAAAPILNDGLHFVGLLRSISRQLPRGHHFNDLRGSTADEKAIFLMMGYLRWAINIK